MVRKYQAMTEGVTRRGKLPRPAEVGEAQRRLADYLQTRVRVDLGKRKGKIVMDFVSLEELDRLTGLIAGPEDPRPPTTVRPE
jgi:ParB family chromosome partitioning protein